MTYLLGADTQASASVIYALRLLQQRLMLEPELEVDAGVPSITPEQIDDMCDALSHCTSPLDLDDSQCDNDFCVKRGAWVGYGRHSVHFNTGDCCIDVYNRMHEFGDPVVTIPVDQQMAIMSAEEAS